MANPLLTVPNPVTFEQAIALTQTLLEQMEHALPEADIEAAIAQLVASYDGARGFFVTYLTDERPLADAPSAAVVAALQSSPSIVAELLVKNIAMSSVMAITHRQNQNETMAQGSEQVRSRAQRLIQLIQLPEVTQQATALQHSAAKGSGEYQAFLDRWGYDTTQRQVIQDTMAEILAR